MSGTGRPIGSLRTLGPAALLGLLLGAYFLTYGTRDVPRQAALIADLREQLAGLDDRERRSRTFHAVPARRRLYRDYFDLIEGVGRETAEDARVGFVWGPPRYLFRFTPYYLHPRHTFEVEAGAEDEAVEELRLDAVVVAELDGRGLRYSIRHVD